MIIVTTLMIIINRQKKIEETTTYKQQQYYERNYETIGSNKYNEIPYTSISDQQLCNIYLMDYRSNMINHPEDAYELLDEEYRESRFGDIEKYKEYIKKNEEKIFKMKLSKFKITKYKDGNRYTCIDQYDNYYIFRETAIMKYSVILDTYTLDDLPEYVERYNKADEQKKTAYCVDRFIKALNDDNYKFAYSLLADSFKQKYFKTYQSFENYAKKNFAGKPKEAFSGFTNEGNVYNTISVTLSKSEDDVTDALTKTFIVKLGEGTKFELSFNVD